MANRFLNNITINDEYTLPAADGTADQVLTTDGAGQLVFVDQDTIASGSAEVVEVPVKNLQGSALTKGDPVYISGSVGSSGILEVQLADAGNSGKMPAVGLLKQDLAANAEGFAVVTGELRNLITSPIDGVTPNPNAVIYVKSGGSTGAALTTVKPGGSTNLIQNVGKVGRPSTSADGTLVVSSILRSNDVPNLPLGRLFVGTNTNTSLTSDVVYIDDANDRVGIGTPSPSFKLDVSGDGIRNIRSTAGWAGWFENTASSSGIVITAGVDSGDAPLLVRKQDATEIFSVRGNGVSWFNGGNVGIGTTSPAVRLDYGSTVNQAFHLYTNGADYYGINMTQYDSGPYSTNIFSGNGGQIKFRTASGTSTQSTRMTITQTGNVGIGTTSPLGALQVNEYTVGAQGNQTVHGELSVFANSGDESLFLGIKNATYPNRGWAFNPVTNGVNSDLQIKEHGSSGVRMTIKTGGNVGIGTTSPDQKLHVEGSVLIDSYATNGVEGGIYFREGFDGSSTKYNLSILNYDHGGAGTTSTDGLSINGYDGVSFCTGSNTRNERMRINSSGNVGIGTTSPDTPLDVSSESSTIASFRATGGASNNKRLEIGSGGDRTIIKSFTDTTDAASALAFSNGNSEAMRIDSGGDVGIGTTSPTVKLDVRGTMLVSGDTPDARIGSTLEVYRNGSTAELSIHQDDASASSTFSQLRFRNGGNDTYLKVPPQGQGLIIDTENKANALVISTFGDLGIGNTSPTQILHVTGNARVTGAYYDSNNSAGTSGQVLSSTATGTSWVGGSGLPGGPYLPLAGGTMTGNLKLNDNVQLQVGSSADLQILHDASDSFLINNTGDLYLRNLADDKDIIFQSDDGSGGVETYFELQGVSGGGSPFTVFPDLSNLVLGSGHDFRFYHTGSTSFIENYTGDIQITNYSDDRDIIFKSDDGAGNTAVYFKLDGSLVNGTTTLGAVNFPDKSKIFMGTGSDFKLYHDGSNSYIENETGNLTIFNKQDDGDVSFASDNGSGGTTEYLRLDGGITSLVASKDLLMAIDGNGGKLKFGASQDLQIYHEGTDSIIQNYTGSIYIDNNADDQDITFRCDNGSGGLATYFRIDGSQVENTFLKNTRHFDNVKAYFGDSEDLQIYHDGSNSYVHDSGTGELRLNSDNAVRIRKHDNETMALFTANGAAELWYDNAKKIETTSSGVYVTGTATATTFSGDLNGTINTATTAVTKPNATNDTTVATTAFVQNLIGTIPAGLVFQGTWNAATNTPTLSSGSGTTGHFYIVSTDGSTNLDGITDWKVGDWAVFVEQGATDAWEKVDNSSVLDGAGTGQTVAMWSGSGTSNTLTNAPITFSGNDATFAGTIDSKAITALAKGAQLGTSGYYINSTFKDTGDNVGVFLAHNDTANGTGAIAGINQLAFLTYGSAWTQALLLDSNQNATFAGDVGIGVSPSQPLDVNGTALIRNTIYVGDDIQHWGDGGTGMFFGTDTISLKNDGGSTRLFVKSGGNVGIGETNPLYSLDVNSGADNTIARFLSSDDVGQIQISDNDTDTWIGSKNGLSYISKTAGTPVDGIVIDNSNNVGIGTISPSGKFNSYISATRQLTHNGNGGDLSIISDNNSSPVFYVKGTGTADLVNVYDNTNEVFTIKDGGNVGIGATDPLRKLHVVGGVAVNAATNQYYGVYISGAGEGADPSILIGDWHNASATLKWDSSARSLNIDTQYSTGAGTFNITGNDGASTFLTVNTSGNVGIGETNPSEELHISSSNPGVRLQDSDGTNTFGRVHFTGSTLQYYSRNNTSNGLHAWYGSNGTANTEFMRLQNDGELRLNEYGSGTFTGTATQRLGVDSSGNVIEIPIGSGPVDGSGTANYVTKWSDADTIGNSIIYDNGTNVGIGTTSPTSAKLVISGVPTADYVVDTNGRLKIKGDGTLWWGAAADYGKLTWDTGKAVVRGESGKALSLGANGTQDTIYINTSQNVGIGSTNPTNKLRIDAAAGQATTLSNSITNAAVYINSDTANGSNNIRIGESGSGSYFLQASNSSGTTPYAINLNPFGGNVGIGTTSPAEELSVSGDSNITGKLAVGSSAAHPTYDFYNQNTAYFNGAVTVDDTITVNNLTYPEPGAIDASGYNGEIVYFGSQISMSEGKLMVLSTSAAGLTWYQAKDSTSSLATGMLGIALGTAASAGVLVRGIAKNSAWSSFSEGEKLYLSPTSGAISNSITSDTNDFVRIIGYALGGNKIYFCPDNSYVQNS